MARSKPQAVVGIVFHSGLDDLVKAVRSVYSHPECVVMVLDASPSQEARAFCDDLGIVHLNGSRNGGYAWGMNELLKRSRDECEIFIACNPDVVFHDGSLSQLLAEVTASQGFVYPMQVTQDGQVAPFTLHPTISAREVLAKSLWLTRRWPSLRPRRVLRNAIGAQGPILLPRGVVGSGAVVCAPVWLWAEVEGFDDRFFLFGEDRELGQRLHEAGVPAYLSTAKVSHEGGFRSRSRNPAFKAEALLSQRIYWQKWVSRNTVVLSLIQGISTSLRLLAVTLSGSEEGRRIWCRVAELQCHMYRKRLGIDRLPTGGDMVRVPLQEYFSADGEVGGVSA